MTVHYTSSSRNQVIIYQLRKSIIIGTSNLYQTFILNAFQNKMPMGDLIQGFKVKNIKEQGYSQEFLSRVTIIPFGPVPKGLDYQALLGKKLENFF